MLGDAQRLRRDRQARSRPPTKERTTSTTNVLNVMSAAVWSSTDLRIGAEHQRPALMRRVMRAGRVREDLGDQ
jgi:hypothetical protein